MTEPSTYEPPALDAARDHAALSPDAATVLPEARTAPDVQDHKSAQHLALPEGRSA